MMCIIDFGGCDYFRREVVSTANDARGRVRNDRIGITIQA